MKHVLDFDARDFRADAACENNTVERRIMTLFGKNIEQFVIGDWDWHWSQIICEKELSPQTEYVFRFALMGGVCDTQDETSQFILVPRRIWDDRYVYELAHSRFQPVLSKEHDGGLLRVYEIAFDTMEHTEPETYLFIFVSSHCKTAVLPAFSLEAYTELPDLSYADWWAQHSKTLTQNQTKHAAINLTGARLSHESLAMLLAMTGSGTSINLCGARIEPATEQEHAEEAAADMPAQILDALQKYGMLKAEFLQAELGIEREEAGKMLAAMHAMEMIGYDEEMDTYLPLA